MVQGVRLSTREGDRFVDAEHNGAELKPGDLQLDAPPVLAWSKDPKSGVCATAPDSTRRCCCASIDRQRAFQTSQFSPRNSGVAMGYQRQD